MDARHRIRIVAASIAVVAIGGRAGQPLQRNRLPTPNSVGLRSSASTPVWLTSSAKSTSTSYDDGLSVVANAFDADECMAQALGLRRVRSVSSSFVGVLTFGGLVGDDGCIAD